jgi:hypothetical protein
MVLLFTGKNTEVKEIRLRLWLVPPELGTERSPTNRLDESIGVGKLPVRL